VGSWHELVREAAPPWPYPVRYGSERQLAADVLVAGGGIAGCHAAIAAARAGARVVVLEKGAVKWGGNGGAGVDHWLAACTNPCSRVSPEQYARRVAEDSGGYDCGPLRFVNAREGWDALLDCERLGVRIRDGEGEFAGADFRDPHTGLLFAYDYSARMDLRVFGHNMKPHLHGELARLGVQVLDRVMLTALLADGERVTGAVGLATRTGELVVVRAGATVLATGLPGRLWLFSTEYRSSFRDPNCAADGLAAAWNAGARFARLEESYPDPGPMAYLSYGVGNAHNTWHGCPIVDACGREVPWVDRDGRELAVSAQRFRPSPGQPFMLGHGQRVPESWANRTARLAPDLPERIRRGEFQLPLYADLTRLPAAERRAIFGLMVGNEGRTRVPVYQTLARAGFDPERDLLQVPCLEPEAYGHANFWAGMLGPHWRQWGGGGLLVDWDLATSLEGLFAAGGAVYGGGAHSSAAASGRYAGRQAAAAARTAPEAVIHHDQVRAEKERLYAPLRSGPRGIGWKEMNAAICRVMQDHCGQAKSEGALLAGLRLLQGMRESEARDLTAANPHELARAAECLALLTAGEAVLEACLARRSSCALLNFQRLDFPEEEPPERCRLLVLRKEGQGASAEEQPLDWHLRPPYEAGYEENYRRHCRRGREGE
jgi:succinate dehydrogenase/fumarate reductase flavoprotein subunit